MGWLPKRKESPTKRAERLFKEEQEKFASGESSWNQSSPQGGVYGSLGNPDDPNYKPAKTAPKVVSGGGGSSVVTPTPQPTTPRPGTPTPKPKAVVDTPLVRVPPKRQPTPITGLTSTNRMLKPGLAIDSAGTRSYFGGTRGRVKSYISSEKAKDELAKLKKEREIKSRLQKQTIIPTKFERDYEKRLRSRIKSVPVTEREIIEAGDNRGTIQTITGRGTKPILKSDEVVYGVAKVRQQIIQEQLQKDFQREYEIRQKREFEKIDPNKFQERIDKGEDFGKVNAEYLAMQWDAQTRLKNFSSSYPNEWYNQRGDKLVKEAEKQLNRVSAIYGSKEAQANVGKYFKKGAIFGGAVGVAQIGLTETGAVSTATLSTIGTGALAVAGGVYAYGLGKGGYTSLKEYKRLRDVGFSKREAKQQAILKGADVVSPMAYGALGAVTGRLAVIGTYTGVKNLVNTGTLRGLTPNDKVIINRVAHRPNAISQEVVSGKLTQSETVKIASSEKGLDFLDNLDNTHSIKKISVKLSTQGLSGEELSAVNKYNSLVNTIRYQVVDSSGNVVKGNEITLQKVGKIFPQKTYTTGLVSGEYSGDKFTGERLTLKSGGGDTGEITYEKLVGSGKVKTYGNYRAEFSKGVSAKLWELGISNNEVISVKTAPKVITSESLGLSKITDISLEATPKGTQTYIKQTGKVAEIKTGDILDIKGSKIYQDVFGYDKGGDLEQVYKIYSPKTKPFNLDVGDTSGINLKQIQLNSQELQNIVLPESPSVINTRVLSSTTNIQTNMDLLNKQAETTLNKINKQTETTLNKIKQKQSSEIITFESLKQKPTTKVKGKDFTRLSIKNLQWGDVGIGLNTLTSNKLKTKQLQKMEQVTMPDFNTPTFTNLDLPDFNLWGGGLWGKKIKFGGAKSTKKSGIKRPRYKQKYTASLGSAVFNIKRRVTKKQAKQLQSAEYWGVETKPLLEITDLYPKKKKKNISM